MVQSTFYFAIKKPIDFESITLMLYVCQEKYRQPQLCNRRYANPLKFINSIVSFDSPVTDIREHLYQSRKHLYKLPSPQRVDPLTSKDRPPAFYLSLENLMRNQERGVSMRPHLPSSSIIRYSNHMDTNTYYL